MPTNYHLLRDCHRKRECRAGISVADGTAASAVVVDHCAHEMQQIVKVEKSSTASKKSASWRREHNHVFGSGG